MTTTTPLEASAADMATGLRSVLDQLVAAMADGDAGAVLAVEPALRAAAARQAPASRPYTSAERDAIRVDIASARAALARCRALGAGAALVAAATLEALGRVPSYSRQGAGPSRSLRGRGLKARV